MDEEPAGPPPLAAEGAPQLAGEGEDFDAVVLAVADVQLLANHRQATSLAEMLATKPEAFRECESVENHHFIHVTAVAVYSGKDRIP